MDKLKDIKPIVDIPDNSFIYLLLVIFIILLMAGFLYWKSIQSKNNHKKIAIEKLQKLNFSNSKMVAYDFKKYASVLCCEDNKVEFEQINIKLEQYKYKKQVDDLDLALIQKIKDFINA